MVTSSVVELIFHGALEVVVHRFADCDEVQEAPTFVLEAFFFFTKTKHHGNLRVPPQGHPPQEIAGPNKAFLRETNG